MIFLQDLLKSKDLSQAANNLVRELRDGFGLPRVHQLGMVVPNVEQAARDLEVQGIGPVLVVQGSPALWRERGEGRRIQGKIGLVHYQGLDLSC